MIGRTLGHYDITGAIGAGGMGEVYRATDTRLGREVALKLLPSAFASDAERLARFGREAKLLASLNHPNIAHVYGFDSATLPDGSAAHFLAMELVPGEDLAERLKRGAIPLDEALAIAKQVAEALEEAHEKGIVHRDLKPANVKLTPDGKVKVLDFGLAKAYAGDTASGSSADLSHSPTLAHTGTGAGLILGTAAYMSPEQARGKPADKRADIWSFGVVLFEMLTGQRLFAGETVSDVLAGVLKTEIDLGRLPESTPPAIRRLLSRCLERDPGNRLRDVGDAHLEITAASEPDEGSRSAAPVRFASGKAAALMAALGLAALALGLLHFRQAGPAGLRDVVRTSIALPHGHALVAGPEISRDGQRIAFVSTDGLSRPQLYTRRLDEAELRVLAGTEEADMPFFSPDGRWIAFYARGGFYKVRVDGGEPVRLADAPTSMGGHWLENDTIIFTKAWNSGLYRISTNGGAAEPLLIPDRKSYYAYTWPFALPGEQTLLCNRWGTTYDLMRLNLADMSQSVMVSSQWRRSTYTASGHIVFSGDRGDLLGLPAGSPASTAMAPEPLLGEVAGGDDPDGYTRASVSALGTLVYAPLDASQRSLVLVDRAGTITTLPGPKNSYEELDLSGDAVPVSTDGGTGAVWSPAGDRLFFRQGRRLMAASVKLGPRLTVAKPEVVLDGGWELGQEISISYYKVNFDLHARRAVLDGAERS